MPTPSSTDGGFQAFLPHLAPPTTVSAEYLLCVLPGPQEVLGSLRQFSQTCKTPPHRRPTASDLPERLRKPGGSPEGISEVSFITIIY